MRRLQSREAQQQKYRSCGGSNCRASGRHLRLSVAETNALAVRSKRSAQHTMCVREVHPTNAITPTLLRGPSCGHWATMWVARAKCRLKSAPELERTRRSNSARRAELDECWIARAHASESELDGAQTVSPHQRAVFHGGEIVLFTTGQESRDCRLVLLSCCAKGHASPPPSEEAEWRRPVVGSHSS